ncbi:DUF1206 domain-containing protein [Alphaproteobacteria bacterium GH1-50]|uniref:DUF1206 domain-containing protein n=1 Tax=Kangsaoukella pontilimi TaxID=2691042 RepID=A0A7C9IGR1_9RHOB|nr:DUF1206 domain-containing protein [Kangsaoukella pontilimi]MXQ08504.1 DUF1206 domain-containing protein [Kangsaoukella pontilimi]
MSDPDFSWAIKMMRAGYAGRGLTYLIVAGVSLYTIWQGGSAEGTQTVFQYLEGTGWGSVALFLIFAGLVAYAIWRVTCAIYDLEDYGTDGEGLIARAGQVTTGLIHGALGIAAFLLLFSGTSGGDQSGVAKAAAAVMEWPGGRWIVGFAGLCTIGAGIYYGHKAWTEAYREHLIGNEFTLNWNWVLKAGVMAQGVIVGIIGVFILYAGITANPNEASGLGGVWEFLGGQPFGQFLVVLICIGLLGFAVFCFVNARYRIVPKATEKDLTTLAAEMKARAT